MIELKIYIKELRNIEKNLNASEDATNSYAWVCALEAKLHSLDELLYNQKSIVRH